MIRYAFLIFFTLISCTSFAQIPHVEWVKTLDSYQQFVSMPYSSEPKAIVEDRDKNIYVAGMFLRSLDLDAGAGADSVYSENFGTYIIKYTPGGEYLWGKTIPNTKAHCLATDNAGNIYLGGEMYGSVDFDAISGRDTFTSKGAADFYLAKINIDGDVVWVRASGSYYGDAVLGITADDNGNVYTTGYMYGNVDFDERNPGAINYITMYSDAFIARYNVNGDLDWSHRIHGAGGDNGYGIRLSQSNELVIVGGTEGCRFVNGGSLYAGNGRNDGFVAKYNRMSGNLIWAKVFGGNMDEWNTSVDVDVEGNIYVGGAFSSSSFNFESGNPATVIAKSGGGTYSTDAYLLKLGADGSFKWANSTQSLKDEVINSVQVDDSGYVYGTGRFGEGSSSVTMSFSPGFNSGQVLNSIAGVDIFILKTGNDGTLKWSASYGTEAMNDLGASLYVNDKFEVYFSGMIGKTTRFGPVDIDPVTGLDNALGQISNATSDHNTSTFFMKYRQYENDSVSVPTSLEDLGLIGLHVYPNPARDVLYVEAEGQFKRMVICDVLGRTILDQKIRQSKEMINIRHLPPGQYFLNIYSEKELSGRSTFIKE
ncbi:MAG: T9SS type A sorting domain-containing protein [Chryseobacterium sp.]|nr:MAG: T9SS type A sorting domain-containing protein [Chryseobacterium sp.]